MMAGCIPDGPPGFEVAAPPLGHIGRERRRHARVPVSIRAVCGYFNSAVSHGVTTVNLGREGLSILAPVAFRQGAPVTMRLIWPAAGWGVWSPEAIAFRHLGVAEVKWCLPAAAPGEAGFRLGLRYFPCTR